jgi:periplasmic protein TonB
VPTDAQRIGAGAGAVPVFGLSLLLAAALHGGAAFVLLNIDVDRLWRSDAPVEFQVAEPPPPPPPEVRPEPVEQPPPVEPKVVTRRVAPSPPVRERPSPAPPPPNETPPPNAPTNAPPVFGVTMSSTVSGEAAMAVPVGNTTMTKPSASVNKAPPTPYAGTGAPAVVPEPEINIGERPRVLHEVNSDDYYPQDARTLGIEGTVRLSVTINEHGKVVAVRVVRRAGHGFDEKAVQAMKQFLFSPARRSGDNRPVAFTIPYDFTFSLNN